jgi:hypothetical protein
MPLVLNLNQQQYVEYKDETELKAVLKELFSKYKRTKK